MVNIDYGDSFTAQLDELFEMPITFVKRSTAELVKCTLHSVDYDSSGRGGPRLSDTAIRELETLLEESYAGNDLSVSVVQESGNTVQNRVYSVILKSKKPTTAKNPVTPVINVNEVMIAKLNLLLERQTGQSGRLRGSPSSPASATEVPPAQAAKTFHLPTLTLPAVGSKAKATVVYTVTPSDIFLMLERDASDFDNIANRVSTSKTSLRN